MAINDEKYFSEDAYAIKMAAPMVQQAQVTLVEYIFFTITYTLLYVGWPLNDFIVDEFIMFQRQSKG